jgi:hypothetical protein
MNFNIVVLIIDTNLKKNIEILFSCEMIDLTQNKTKIRYINNKAYFD